MPQKGGDSRLNPSSNRTRKKSRLGCKTCKIRKVKCDECYPLCGNCTKYWGVDVVSKCEWGPNPREGDSTSSSDTPPIEKKVASHSSKTSKSQVQVLRRSVNLPMKAPSMQLLDPFGTTQKSKFPFADKLIHYFLVTCREKCVPVGFKPENNPLMDQWWPLIQRDSFVHHVMLQVAAVDLEWASGMPNMYHSDLYTKENLRLLRMRLEDPINGISDETIVAVSTLAVVEYGMGNMRVTKMHIDGLKRMIRLRGGLEKVRASNSGIASFTFWITLLITSEPQFPVEDPSPDAPDSQLIRLDSHLYNFPPDMIKLEDFIDDRAVVEVLAQVRCYFHDFAKISGTNLSLPHNMDIHSRNGWLVHRVLQKPPLGICRTPITECCRFATAILMFLPFDNHFPDSTLIRHSLLQKLKDALCSIVPCTESENPLVIWLLTVGGVAAADSPAERDWFIGYLIDTADNMHINSWDELKEYLRRVIWMDALKDQPFRELWEDMTLLAKSQTTRNPFGTSC